MPSSAAGGQELPDAMTDIVSLEDEDAAATWLDNGSAVVPMGGAATVPGAALSIQLLAERTRSTSAFETSFVEPTLAHWTASASGAFGQSWGVFCSLLEPANCSEIDKIARASTFSFGRFFDAAAVASEAVAAAVAAATAAARRCRLSRAAANARATGPSPLMTD